MIDDSINVLICGCYFFLATKQDGGIEKTSSLGEEGIHEEPNGESL
jgi:hypothetical protein